MSGQDYGICVFHLSSPYGGLRRLFHYSLLCFLLFNPTENNLAKGALAAVMIHSTVTVIHAFILLATAWSSALPFDLDLWGCWTLLSVTVIVQLALLDCRSYLRKSKARPLIRIWGFLTGVGTICVYVGLRKSYQQLGSSLLSDYGLPHLTGSESESLRSCAAGEDCLATCTSSSRNVLRNGRHGIEIMDPYRLFAPSYRRILRKLAYGVLVFVAFTIWASFNTAPEPKPPAPGSNVEFAGAAARSTPPLPATSVVTTPETRFSKARALYRVSIAIRTGVGLFAAPFVLTATIALNEAFMLRWPGLPSAEGPIDVGQWGAWAALGLVLGGALVGGTAKGRKAKRLDGSTTSPSWPRCDLEGGASTVVDRPASAVVR